MVEVLVGKILTVEGFGDGENLCWKFSHRQNFDDVESLVELKLLLRFF